MPASDPSPRPSSAPSLSVALLARTEPGSALQPLAYVEELACALARAGVAVQVLTDQDARHHTPSVSWLRVPAAAPGTEGPVAAARAYCANLLAALDRQSRERMAFHVVHAVSWATAPAALAMRRHGGACSVVTFLHTVFSRQGQCGGDRDTTQIHHLEHQIVRDADLVVAGNESVRRELAWLYGADPGRVRVVPAEALPDEDAVVMADPAQPPRLAFAGVWSTEGGADLFLEALALLRADHPDLRVVVEADSVSPARVEADFRRRGLLDVLDRSAPARALLPSCQLAVAPARAALGYRGAYRARSLGLPLVVTRTGPAEVVDPHRTGRLAFPFPASLAKEIGSLLAHPLPRIADDSFTWARAAFNLMVQYREILRTRGSPAESTHDVERAARRK